MSVHAFFPGLLAWILLVATSIICLVGILRLVSRWGHARPVRFLAAWAHEAFRDGFGGFLRVLVLDVLLFRRIWRRSRRRWAVHMAMFWVFALLGGFVLLSILALVLVSLDPAGFGGAFAVFMEGLQLPYSVAGYVLAAASGAALARRLIIRDVRQRTRVPDFFLVGSVFVIAMTGVVAEWFSGFDPVMGPGMKNWDLALQVLSLHIYAVFLLFVMMIPWSRFRHILASPLLLLARRGGD